MMITTECQIKHLLGLRVSATEFVARRAVGKAVERGALSALAPVGRACARANPLVFIRKATPATRQCADVGRHAIYNHSVLDIALPRFIFRARMFSIFYN